MIMINLNIYDLNYHHNQETAVTHKEVKDSHIHDVQQTSAAVIWGSLFHLLTVVWIHLPPRNAHGTELQGLSRLSAEEIQSMFRINIHKSPKSIAAVQYCENVTLRHWLLLFIQELSDSLAFLTPE